MAFLETMKGCKPPAEAGLGGLAKQDDEGSRRRLDKIEDEDLSPKQVLVLSRNSNEGSEQTEFILQKVYSAV